MRAKTVFAASLWILLLSWSTPALALDSRKTVFQYSIDVWQEENGLPQSSVQAIAQTRDGYIWLATQEGLVRFDGVRFVVFDKTNSPGLEDNVIRALCPAMDGGLWIGTDSAGMVRMTNGRFFGWTTKSGLSSNLISSIAQDGMGGLWIGTQGGLNRMKDGRLTAYSAKDGIVGERIEALYVDKKGTLWLASGNVLHRFDGERFTVCTTPKELPGRIRTLGEDREGSLWIGTAAGLGQLTNGRLRLWTTRDGLSGDDITSVLVDRQDNIWVGTSGRGLNRIAEGRIAALATGDGLSNDSISSMLEDAEGSLWVGTEGGGLDRLKDGRFTTFTTKDGLSENMVCSILEDREGNLWIGTESGGLNRYRDGTFRHFSKKDGLSNFVRALGMDRDGNLWVGTKGDGLYRMMNGKIVRDPAAEAAGRTEVYTISADREGALWFGTLGNGLYSLIGGKLRNYRRKDGLPSNSVVALLSGDRGELWIGTNGRGLALLKDGKFTVYDESSGLSSNLIDSFYLDARGILWIGTGGGGLDRLEDGRVTVYTKKNGLFDDVVFQILEDTRGNFWMSCNKGIFFVPRHELDAVAAAQRTSVTSVAFGKPDGMKSRECNGFAHPAGWKTKDGRLWFPTIKGVAMIDPENMKLNELPPPVVIEQFLVDDETIDLGENVRLSPGKKNFEFRYAGLSFLIPERVKFKYKLEGFNKEWIDAGTRRSAYYTNIPPGPYRFRVIACNNDGVWNESGASFNFYLKPYFYQTIFFYLLCGLGGVAIALGGFRIRIRQLKAREKHLSLLVEERTRELKQTNQELERLSLTDKLTEIANRRNFDVFLDREWRRCAREGRPLSLIMADIDFFKAYNDTYGHQAGDECLRKVAQILKKNVGRAGDLAARYGGEEFIIILSETGAEGAAAVAEKLKSAVEALRMAHERSKVAEYVTISLGCASCIPSRESEPSSLISAADGALYQSKQKGRNRISTVSLSSIKPSVT